MVREFQLGSTKVYGQFLSDEMLRLVMKTWDRLPPDDREKINRYWNHPSTHGSLKAPIMAVTAGEVDGRGQGATNLNGFLIRLSDSLETANHTAGALGRPLDEDAISTIAHEFGHVYEHASGEYVEPILARERYANQKLIDWKIDIPISTRSTHPEFLPQKPKAPWLS